MTSAQHVRNVLPEDYRDLIVEDRGDGSTVVRDARLVVSGVNGSSGFPVSATLARCADLLADSGFVVMLVRDEDGVYLNAS